MTTQLLKWWKTSWNLSWLLHSIWHSWLLFTWHHKSWNLDFIYKITTNDIECIIKYRTYCLQQKQEDEDPFQWLEIRLYNFCLVTIYPQKKYQAILRTTEQACKFSRTNPNSNIDIVPIPLNTCIWGFEHLRKAFTSKQIPNWEFSPFVISNSQKAVTCLLKINVPHTGTVLSIGKEEWTKKTRSNVHLKNWCWHCYAFGSELKQIETFPIGKLSLQKSNQKCIV